MPFKGRYYIFGRHIDRKYLSFWGYSISVTTMREVFYSVISQGVALFLWVKYELLFFWA